MRFFRGSLAEAWRKICGSRCCVSLVSPVFPFLVSQFLSPPMRASEANSSTWALFLAISLPQTANGGLDTLAIGVGIKPCQKLVKKIPSQKAIFPCPAYADGLGEKGGHPSSEPGAPAREMATPDCSGKTERPWLQYR